MSKAGENQAETRELLLVGGGHSHVQVLRRFAMAPEPGVHLTLVVAPAEAVYSGMVPGVVAGDHPLSDATIDCLPLARRARARVILAEALRIDPDARRLELMGRPPLRYDVASLNVGGSVAALDVPGVREHAIPTRPIGAFVKQLEERIGHLGRRAGGEASATPRPVEVAVVGGGAAGCELALCIEARLRRDGCAPRVTLVASEPELRPGPNAALGRAVHHELSSRGIDLVLGRRVTQVEEKCVVLDDGRSIGAEITLLATGAAPAPLLRDSALPSDAQGFVRIDEQLRVVGRRNLFAAGDCAAFDVRPLAKAGVYAVRQGPVLADNLRRVLADRPLRRYAPQLDFLVLVNAGGHRAVGGRGNRSFSGRAVWHWKRIIDRRFMRRFQVLDADGSPAPGFPSPESMGMEEMPCGGCAAKLGPESLASALARLPAAPDDPRVLSGVAAADDVATVRTRGGELLLTTVDGFRAFTDDPYLVGRVAAVNAASDVHAKGGVPAHALAWVGVPDTAPGEGGELLFQALSGVRAALDPLGVSLVGGHTTTADELVVGLSIWGEMPDGRAPIGNGTARPGDALILTKPLGSGVVLAADMRGLATSAWVEALHRQMLRANDQAGRIALELDASASTDVSGFGLARHAAEMAQASGVAIALSPSQLRACAGALDLLERGVRSTFHASNRTEAPVDFDGMGSDPQDPRVELCFDPQTAGGLLIAVPEAGADAALEALRAAGEEAARVGQVLPARDDGQAVTLLRS